MKKSITILLALTLAACAENPQLTSYSKGGEAGFETFVSFPAGTQVAFDGTTEISYYQEGRVDPLIQRDMASSEDEAEADDIPSVPRILTRVRYLKMTEAQAEALGPVQTCNGLASITSVPSAKSTLDLVSTAGPGKVRLEKIDVAYYQKFSRVFHGGGNRIFVFSPNIEFIRCGTFESNIPYYPNASSGGTITELLWSPTEPTKIVKKLPVGSSNTWNKVRFVSLNGEAHSVEFFSPHGESYNGIRVSNLTGDSEETWSQEFETDGHDLGFSSSLGFAHVSEESGHLVVVGVARKLTLIRGFILKFDPAAKNYSLRWIDLPTRDVGFMGNIRLRLAPDQGHYWLTLIWVGSRRGAGFEKNFFARVSLNQEEASDPIAVQWAENDFQISFRSRGSHWIALSEVRHPGSTRCRYEYTQVTLDEELGAVRNVETSQCFVTRRSHWVEQNESGDLVLKSKRRIYVGDGFLNR